jgi:tRNA pseudouridine38-40 synthase
LHNYALKIAYNGSPFCGFARQPQQLTVQGNLESALSTITRQEIQTVCAGRTDAGVHARGQVVNFFTNDKIKDADSFLRSTNALTHDGISILDIKEVDEDFSARFSATKREYRYFISNSKTPPIFSKDFSWHVAKPLDVQAMEEGSEFIIGEHDFRSFCLACSADKGITMRNVESISFEHVQNFGEELLQITIIGNAFLHSMVRTIVGTLVEVGKGKKPQTWIQDVLNARTRQAAGENAPAKGLVFWKVYY